jgi:hypothetical protein
MSGLAPLHVEGLDWFAGMAAAGAAELGAATRGRAALVDHLSTTDFDPEQFTPANHAALAGTWSCPAATAGGWPAGSPRPSCGYARRTATSRSSARPGRLLAGSGSTQAWAEPRLDGQAPVSRMVPP